MGEKNTGKINEDDSYLKRMDEIEIGRRNKS